MAAPSPKSGPTQSHLTVMNPTAPHRPIEALTNTQSTTDALAATQLDVATAGKRRRNHRAGKKTKKNHRQSFLPGTEEGDKDPARSSQNVVEPQNSGPVRPPFYTLGKSSGRNLSESSLASEALLDHRDHAPMRPRRESRAGASAFGRAGQSNQDLSSQYRPPHATRNGSHEGLHHKPRYSRAHKSSGDESGDNNADTTDRTPLLTASHNGGTSPSHRSAYGMYGGNGAGGRRDSNRRNSTATSSSSKHRRRKPLSRQQSASGINAPHDVNNPPSVPNSPKLGPDMGFDDVMVTDSFAPRSLDDRRATTRDYLIDIGDDGNNQGRKSTPPTPRGNSLDQRRHTIALPAEDDVCFPTEGMSVIGEEDYTNQDHGTDYQQGQRKRRGRQWPDLSVLDEWSREEKEERSEGIRAKKISEPVLVAGRLRPQKHGWHRAEEDAPYRFTYFNEEFPSTIHSQTLSELLQPGQDFRELFIPDPPELSDQSSDEEDLISHQDTGNDRPEMSPTTQSRLGTRHSSITGGRLTQSPQRSGDATPAQFNGSGQNEKPKRYGERPTFWLDVLSPTDTEMRVISKTFGIHPLTAEDIITQEAREKVELFKKYYFVNYRTFEQDKDSEDFLEAVNMYAVVFPEGVISFHFSMTPHPANVRRRIRQLRDYVKVSSDWIAYALIDDITDAFAPPLQDIEEEVDDIDDAILRLHSDGTEEVNEKNKFSKKDDEKGSDCGEASPSGRDELRRVGEGRKKVMRLSRLIGNKADVIKGFAKRCNERWEIAPRSDIGLYLGDIQDHIVTMTSNLSHYETLLSRAHSNYLAQISIRMNERQEQTADVLGKLTVLGTIVLPMNIITGMWGMNVQVPGQESDSQIWFWCITAGLFAFGVSCFFIAKRVYGIV